MTLASSLDANSDGSPRSLPLDLQKLLIDQVGRVATDVEYAAVIADIGCTTELMSRVESACVVLGLGASRVGMRTKHALMHPLTEYDDDDCNRDAAAMVFLVLAALLADVPPARLEQISRVLNEYRFSSEGLL